MLGTTGSLRQKVPSLLGEKVRTRVYGDRNSMFTTTDVKSVASLLLSSPGSLIAYPTETFYGLGTLIHDPEGLRRIVEVKGRDAAKGMIILAADMDMAAAIAVIDESQDALLRKIWPGPVSVMLQAAKGIDPLLAPGGKIALRISSNSLATSLVGLAGPITSTSANRSGEPPARRALEVEGFGMDIDAILDGGQTPGGKPSTLIDLTVRPPRCLREGAVPFQDLLGLIPGCRPSSSLA